MWPYHEKCLELKKGVISCLACLVVGNIFTCLVIENVFGILTQCVCVMFIMPITVCVHLADLIIKISFVLTTFQCVTLL